MTAEIAILNRAAVAIAADSAVTLAADHKVYKTANKIFPLSLDPPIVIMFHGSGALGPIPWETIVEEYKRNSSTDLATVEEYGSDFIGFLPQMIRHISHQAQSEFVRTEILWELEQLSRIAQSNLSRFVRTGPSSDSQKLEFFLQQIDNSTRSRLEYLTNIGSVDGLTARSAKRQLADAVTDWELFGTRVSGWDSLLDLWFSQLPELLMHRAGYLSREIRDGLQRVSLQSLLTADWSPDSTGVVLAGFGDDQVFPSLTHWIVDQVMDDIVKCRRLENICIDDAQSSAIVPFAQQYEVARTLIDGIHPEFLKVHHESVFGLLALLAETISERILKSIPAPLSGELVDFVSRLPTEMVRTIPDELEILVDQYSSPLLEIIQGLPKEHLGEMAETLVSLASFKEMFTPGADIVGGPIDVAVISRSDGLVWVKHKQYYEQEFGPRTAGRKR